MPHLTLEYTANLAHSAPSRALLLSIHHLLNATAGIRVENCKSRWHRVEDWVAGSGEGDSAFVHLDLRFLEGRSLDLQQAVGEGALEILRSHFLPGPREVGPEGRDGGVSAVDLQITVEVGEIREATYFKFPGGTLGPPPMKAV
ncbi:MAG: hypothetical protein R6T96_15080 [Longimicrobiales bacterium]